MNKIGFEWVFLKHQRGYKHREAMQGEFFSASSELGALVRESIQNSLDAAIDPGKVPVHVRIYYSGLEHALQPHQHRYYFTGAWEHFLCNGSGLADPPRATEACPYLVIEDFNTSGLTGDVYQSHEEKTSRNPFYYFYRAEGQSGKSDQDRGRWGIGKFVFPRGSRLRTFLSVTTRHDDGKTFFVGQSILKSRQVGSTYYTPDGWLGAIDHVDTFPLPSAHPEVIDRVIGDFRLKRTRDSYGLSVIVPWCEPVFGEIDESDRLEKLLYEVLAEYFYVIVTGKLTVEIQQGDRVQMIDADFVRHASKNSFKNLEKFISRERARQIALTIAWVDGELPGLEVPGEIPAHAIVWSDNYIGHESAKKIRNWLESDTRFYLNVPAFVKPKYRQDAIRSEMTIIMGPPPASGAEGRPLFIRDGLVISDVRCGIEKAVTAVVVAENSDLATMLGDAENPAHTQWNHETDKFKDKYKYGKSHLDFVRNAVRSIVRLVYREADDVLEDVLSDIFFLPPEEDTGGRNSRVPGSGNGGDIQPPEPPGNAPKVNVRAIEGGFTLRVEGEHTAPLIIRTAYDRRGGNPLKRYNSLDYDLGSNAFEISAEGAEINLVRENAIRVHPVNHSYVVTVQGFSKERDVYVEYAFEEAVACRE